MPPKPGWKRALEAMEQMRKKRGPAWEAWKNSRANKRRMASKKK